ncbi:hypothetical protein RSOLAG1IB_04102 [Rhizoctonia solani AG-1 IB]|uniref:Uncharacterized protein n=1 Tax=Thanatephorus cucumeris (strain AG1-IB / isolate 7/3/14) TaxID=1108050 RepID=A0A0B7FXA3_THACB|nr:hypothetical protein RSOLAG1IB_04102 [Rhizoctonia solani AG-1 IB]
MCHAGRSQASMCFVEKDKCVDLKPRGTPPTYSTSLSPSFVNSLHSLRLTAFHSFDRLAVQSCPRSLSSATGLLAFRPGVL